MSIKRQYSKKRFCLVTGLNISMQKSDSILLSHTGLRYYLKTDIKINNYFKTLLVLVALMLLVLSEVFLS